MKSISHNASVAAASSLHDAVYVLAIEAAGASLRYSTRDIAIDGADYAGIIASVSALSLELPEPFGAESIFSKEPIKVKIVNVLEGGHEVFTELLRLGALYKAAYNLSLLFLSADIIPSASDFIPIGTFELRQASIEDDGVSLFLIPKGSLALLQTLTRIFDNTYIEQADASSIGQPLPVVFGSRFKSPLFPIRTGARARLAKKLNPEDSVVYLDSVAEFQKSGSVQIDNEVISYKEIDSSAGTLGTTASPAARDFPLYHQAGSIAHEIPSGGFVYLAADHQCYYIGAVRAGERILAADEYVIREEALKNIPATLVVFPRLPVNSTSLYNDSVMRIDGANFPDDWLVGSHNSAYYPLSAADSGGSKTCARLTGLRSVLELGMAADLRNGVARFGDIIKISVGLEFASMPPWENSSGLTLSIIKGKEEVSFDVEQPATEGRYFFKYDISAFAAKFNNWGLFSGADNYPLIRLVFKGFNDRAQINIYDVFFEVKYRMRLGARIDENITADIYGYCTRDGYPENPADIARAIIRDERFMCLGDEALDETAFAAAREKLAERNYVFSRRISAAMIFGNVLKSLCGEARLSLIIENGKFKPIFNEPPNLLDEPIFSINRNLILSSSLPRNFTRRDQAVNSLVVRHNGLSYLSPRSVIMKNSAAIDASGVEMLKMLRLYWHNTDSDLSASDLSRYILASSAEDIFDITIETPLTAAMLERGDVVSISLPEFSPKPIRGIIIAAEIPAPHYLRFRIRSKSAGARCWEHDEATYIEHIFGNTRKIFVMDNICVASIDLLGNLILKGEAREGALSNKLIASPINYNEAGGLLEFGYLHSGEGESAVYQRVFALDIEGNLRLSGEALERFDFGSALQVRCVESDAGKISLSLFNLPLITYKKSENSLFIRGEIIEGAPPLETMP